MFFKRITDARLSGCIFCELQADRIITSNALALAIRDNYPVTELHTLVIPKRHCATFFDLFEPERRAINQLLDEVRTDIMKKDALVSGFNIGMNSGPTYSRLDNGRHIVNFLSNDVVTIGFAGARLETTIEGSSILWVDGIFITKNFAASKSRQP
jgi:galactose-1-phosphate uridylyltransferase